MSTITTKDGVEIFYKDWGTGQPIVFSHGWPLSADDWDAQMLFFLGKGFRVIAHDRRGHGRSILDSIPRFFPGSLARCGLAALSCSMMRSTTCLPTRKRSGRIAASFRFFPCW